MQLLGNRETFGVETVVTCVAAVCGLSKHNIAIQTPTQQLINNYSCSWLSVAIWIHGLVYGHEVAKEYALLPL